MISEQTDSQDSQATASTKNGEPRRSASDSEGGQLDTLPPGQLKGVVESLLFVADKPVAPAQLAKATGVTSKEVSAAIEELVVEYEGRGIEVVKIGAGYQFRSAAAHKSVVQHFLARRPVRLTRAQLETLAITAYRQPATRPEIEDIRGVDSGSAIKVLLERELIRILGRKEEPGRPLLYGTSPHFLEFFGMSSLKDLPTLREFSELSDESRELFEHKTGEVADAVLASLQDQEAQEQQTLAEEDEGLDDDDSDDEDGDEGEDSDDDDDDEDEDSDDSDDDDDDEDEDSDDDDDDDDEDDE